MDTNVETVSLHETARERYLNYAMSVITARALPDVRDGLKPVQRRILYGMHRLRLTPDSPYKKSAKVVGDVLGSYHPHGDTAVYDAMVRMAQPFSLRYQLVDGQGNFGSIDGDGAAAMRYTEARLAPLAMELLGDLSDRIVPFQPNYDASTTEPSVLAAGFPNLLVNGATGIAVGMATNIPPHNLTEVIDACGAMIDDPDIELDEVMEFVTAPDFPTGGRILNKRPHLEEIYDKGTGSVDLRGDYSIEREGRQRRIVITSVPYMVNKARLVEAIADHVRANRLPLVVDVRDESTDEVRVVLELKGRADPQAVMAYLFKHTQLQTRFHVNLTCLVPSPQRPGAMQPQRLGLLGLLRYFLDFRFEVVTKRLELKLEEVLAAIHRLEGFEKIFDDLDAAIAEIRAAKDRKDAAARLMARFEIDELQADAILEIRLYRLAQLEIDKVRSELNSKRAEASHIRSLLADDEKRWNEVKRELMALKHRFGDERRTTVAGPDIELSYSQEDYILKENVYVIVTRKGWIKRQRSYTDVSTIRVRDGDEVAWVIYGSTRHTAVIFSDRGTAYTLRIAAIPATTGYGDPIQRHFDFADGESIVGVMVTDPRSVPEYVPPPPEPDLQNELFEEGEVEVVAQDDEDVGAAMLVAVTRSGQCLRMKYFAYEAPSTVAGRRYMRLREDWGEDGDRVVSVQLAGGDENVALATYKSRAITFDVNEISVVRTAGKGVRALALDKGDFVIGFLLTRSSIKGLIVETNRGREQRITPRRFPPVRRGGRGRLLMRRGHLAKVHWPIFEVRPGAGEDDDEDPEESDAIDVRDGVEAPEQTDVDER